MQRAEEPEVTISFHEVTADDLIAGLREGRYDAGMTLEGSSDPSLKSQPLWTENMAVAMPLRFPLLDQAKLTIAELLDYPSFAGLQRIALCWISGCLFPGGESTEHSACLFLEMIAPWVAAGYGVGVSAQSLLEHAGMGHSHTAAV